VSPLPVPANWYAVPLRLIVGFGFLEHGYAKLARGADGFIAILHSIGTPFADLFGWATVGVAAEPAAESTPAASAADCRRRHLGSAAVVC
jgi:uncharacterized membrane protein YphA (DoxX/SURF4 family)